MGIVSSLHSPERLYTDLVTKRKTFDLDTQTKTHWPQKTFTITAENWLTSWTRWNHSEQPTRSRSKREGEEKNCTRWWTTYTPTERQNTLKLISLTWSLHGLTVISGCNEEFDYSKSGKKEKTLSHRFTLLWSIFLYQQSRNIIIHSWQSDNQHPTLTLNWGKFTAAHWRAKLKWFGFNALRSRFTDILNTLLKFVYSNEILELKVEMH